MFRNMTVGKKIACGFGTVLVVLTLVVVLSFTGVGGIVDNAQEVIDGNALDATLAQKEVDHLNWAGQVNALLTDKTVTQLQVETDDHKCGFGKWLYGEGRKQAEHLVPDLAAALKQIEAPHAALHASASEIGASFKQADELLPKFLAEKEVDHLKWMAKCDELFLKNHQTLVIATDDHKCSLGQFIHGQAGKEAAASDAELAGLVEAIKAPHNRLHASAIKIQNTWKQAHPGLINTLRTRLDDHRKWSASVADALLAGRTITVQTDPTKCAFGAWLGGAECNTLRANWPQFDAIIKNVHTHHQALHVSAVGIAKAKDPAARQAIYAGQTVGALGQVADGFAKAIALEEQNVAAGLKAHHLLDTETAAALADTRDVLGKLKDRSVAMLAGMNRAREIYATKTVPALEETQSLLNGLRATARDNIMTQDAMLGAAQGTKRNVGIAGAVGIVIGIVLAFVIAAGIVKSLKGLAAGLASGAEQTSAAAGQVASASQSLAQGASEQAASIEETSSSIEEMNSMVKQNAGNSGQARSLSTLASENANKGAEAMGRMSGAIGEIKRSADQTAKIIKTIDEIAFQTNLLALNAAVEAARAGEAGKGFAVVAEEVRNLAQRSAEAARDTADMIAESVSNADNGVKITEEVAAVLSDIADGNRKVNDLISEIASSTDEQSQGIDQISQAVTQTDTVTQSNAANAEESASASEELAAQAEQLQNMVAELEAMVGGARGQRTAPNASFAPDPTSTPRPARTTHQPNRAVPSSVIPLDVDDQAELTKF